MYCNHITSVTIPNSVTYIEKHAFYTCQNLKNVVFVNSNGWQYYNGTEWRDVDLSNSTTAAGRLTNGTTGAYPFRRQ